MELTAEQLALLPSDDDVAFFRAHGWWVSPPILSADQVESARFGAERYYAGERDANLLIETGTDWTVEDGEVLRQNDYVSLQIEELRQLVETPIVAAAAARLSGSSEIRLFHDQLIYKPPGAAASDTVVGWHTDRAYWQTCSSAEMLTAWIPLQDCTPEMGPLAVLDGSHAWAGNDGLKTFHLSDLAALERRIQAGGERRIVPLTLAAGQVSFHHCRTIHASHPNTSRVPRLAFAVHLQDGANRYRRVLGADGRVVTHLNDILCRRDANGDPDYGDPAICPVLWRGDPGRPAALSGA
jgi:ectoine hydroxylase-related dioxygenase (phytanoyl-CoA dioxygenase family)